MSSERRRAAMPLAFSLTCAALLTVTSVRAATLHAGDVVVLGRFPVVSVLPQNLVVVAPSTGALQVIDPNPALTDMQGMVIRGNGEILVSDGVQGLVSVNPTDGSWQVRHAPAAFGGTAPSALALAPGGDVLAAGMFGIMKLPGGTGAPVPVSSIAFAFPPVGLAGDGANIWVAGEQLLRVDPITGVATPRTLCCSGYTMSSWMGTLQIGSDGFLYAVNFPSGGGPSARANNGVFRIDPVTGVTSLFRVGDFMFSFAFDASGADWICSADNISLTPYGGFVEGNGLRILLNNRGPVAIVPAGFPTPARRTTWGTLKQHYR